MIDPDKFADLPIGMRRVVALMYCGVGVGVLWGVPLAYKLAAGSRYHFVLEGAFIAVAILLALVMFRGALQLWVAEEAPGGRREVRPPALAPFGLRRGVVPLYITTAGLLAAAGVFQPEVSPFERVMVFLGCIWILGEAYRHWIYQRRGKTASKTPSEPASLEGPAPSEEFKSPDQSKSGMTSR